MTQPQQATEDHPLSFAPAHDQAQFYAVLTDLLSAICSSTAWEYGESWIPHGTVLEVSPAWCLSTTLDSQRAVAWTQFQMCSKAFILRPGEGMPGRVWQTQQPVWITDTSAQSEAYFLRNQIARAFGVKAGLGIPLLAKAEVVAVIAVFMSEAKPEDQTLIDQTQAAIANFRNLEQIATGILL
ncbi:MAG TPA: GAF domain-containing protein [Coleofasciculaceae cyanobacterium]